MNGFNLSTISDLYVGSTQYSAIYLGLQKIWERNTEYINQYLTIESLEDNNVISFTSPADETIQRTIYVNKNNTNWYSVTSGPEIQVATLNTGDKLRIYGSSSTYTYSKDGTANNSCIFGSTKTVNLYGNICTLLTDGNIPTSSIDLSGSQYNYCFANLFSNLEVVDASNIVFPITKMSSYGLQRMFHNCTSLVYAPTILPATTLTEGCYREMFSYCTSLTTAPALPATTLKTYCYYYMFNNCTSLTTAPELPAASLTSKCYWYMFYNCSSLKTIKALFTTTPGSYYTADWVRGVSDKGTFVKSINATWTTTGNNGVPSGWTIITE